MYCPQCRYEYRPEFDQCATCGVKLVEALPEPEPVEDDIPRFGPDDEPVAIFSTVRAALIPVLKSVLDAANIPYFLEGEYTFGTGGWSKQTIPWDGVRFFVPRSRAEEASALFERIDGNE